MIRKFFCDDRTVVETDAGKVRGCYQNDHYYFKGIPYCEAKRYQMPEPVKPWEGVRNAVTYGHVAPTVKKPDVAGINALSQQPLFGYRFWPENEKCQYLNVWTKNINNGAKCPVLVWVHGGGYSTGSSVEQMSYDGANLCRDGDLVVVSFNHRLNILGYMDLSDYGEKYWNSGNLGMADIVEALKWVQNNIAKFGGDPDNVTLFGQSGGGMKIGTLLQMPVADKLFHKVIFQSGIRSPGGSGDKDRIEIGKKLAAAYVKNLGLTRETIDDIEKFSFDELREAFLKASDELTAQGVKAGRGIGPIANGYFLGSALEVGFTERNKKTPCIAGTTLAEEVLYAKNGFTEYTAPYEKRLELLHDKFGDNAEKLIELFKKAYPGKDIMTLYNMDIFGRKNARAFIDEKSKFDAPVYFYVLAYDFDYWGGMPAFHGSCLPLVFGNTDYVDVCCEPDAQALSGKMHRAWINFARSGDPNSREVPKWERYQADSYKTMVFDKKCELRSDYDRELIESAAKFTLYGDTLG